MPWWSFAYAPLVLQASPWSLGEDVAAPSPPSGPCLSLRNLLPRILAKPMVANREPLSVLNISGMPLSNLFSRATMQNSHSRDVDISWLKTYRLYQSITTHQVHESGPHSDIRYVARPRPGRVAPHSSRRAGTDIFHVPCRPCPGGAFDRQPR